MEIVREEIWAEALIQDLVAVQGTDPVDQAVDPAGWAVDPVVEECPAGVQWDLARAVLDPDLGR